MNEPPGGGGKARGWLAGLGLDRPDLRGWAIYDWANSAFATTIAAAVLPIYYSTVAAAGLPDYVATSYWGYTLSIALLIVAIASPVLGAVADLLGAKKRFLGVFVAVGVLATAALFLVGEGDWLLASVLFTVGTVGFTGSLVFSDSLLPHIAGEGEVDRVSSTGWALGYAGGGLLLAINAAMIAMPEVFGLGDPGTATRVVFLTVAVWWAVFSIPIFRHVREPARGDGIGNGSGVNPVRAGIRRLGRTLHEIGKYRELAKFLVAFWLYVDGIGTIINMATIYGTEIGIGQNALILALLMVQIVGIPFTFLFGSIAGRIGSKAGIQITLAVYMIIAIFGYFVSEAWHFWALAFMVATVQGGAQALSRSLYATLVPPDRSSEFFGFYSVFRRFAGIAGPFVFAMVGQLMGTSRFGILALVAFFASGAWLLARVDVDAGRRAARENARDPEYDSGTRLAR